MKTNLWMHNKPQFFFRLLISFEQQPLRAVQSNSCAENFPEISRKTSTTELDF